MAETVWLYDFACPKCGLSGHIDGQQHTGQASILCPQCGYFGWNEVAALEIKCANCQHHSWHRNDDRGRHGEYCAATGRSLLPEMTYEDCGYHLEVKRPWKDQAARTKELPWKV